MTVLAAPSRAGRRQAVACRLWHASAVILALMPVVMELSQRSSPLVMTLAGTAALAAAMVDGQGAEPGRGVRRWLSTPLGLAALVFLGFALVSVAWSREPLSALHALGEFVLPIGAAGVLAVLLPQRAPPFAAWLFLICVGIACALIFAELYTDVTLRREIGLRSASYIFNRPVLTVLVLLAPLVQLVTLRARSGMAGLAMAVGALVVGAIGLSDSGAAVLGLIAGALAYGVARLRPRLAPVLLGAGLVIAFALAPVFGDMARTLLPPSLHQKLAQSHSRERVEIWRSFGAAIREEPVTGAGFGMSARFDQDPVAARVPSELRLQLEMGHPHNAAIQVWTELGGIGAVLAVVVLLLMLRALARLPVEEIPPRAALVAAVAAVSLVGHGAWQGWWPAAIGAAIVWLRIAEEKVR